ncbi:hypothetical protein L9F63_005528 [Diploptera punctata]|uniref:NADH-cytochrome b5 reductase n=1 Tax=Diploptera punctata TaxID=6984 RepID=A0AAD7ZE30_DIPPU|nr:hypothetical protein L9F63_005528 [Diploptera punctata]
MDKNNEFFMPPRPEEPLESDCCGSGCSPCIFDIYRKQLLEWEKQCEMLIHNKGVLVDVESNQHNIPVLSQLKFSPFQLISIEEHTHNTYFYTFQAVKMPELNSTASGVTDYVPDKRFLNIKIGEHLIMNGRSTETNKSVISRAYTPISDVNLHSIGCFKVLVKLYEDGRMSKYIKGLKKYDITEWRGPYGDYKYLRASHRFLIMLSAGTGIAPMYPIAKSIVDDDLDETFIHLLFACRHFEDILLRNEIQALTLYWNFKAEIFLSQATSQVVETQSRYSETVHSGRIDKDVISRILSGKKLDQIFVLICGTKPFNKDMINFLKHFGISESNIQLF